VCAWAAQLLRDQSLEVLVALKVDEKQAQVSNFLESYCLASFHQIALSPALLETLDLLSFCFCLNNIIQVFNMTYWLHRSVGVSIKNIIVSGENNTICKKSLLISVLIVFIIN
jgi:hypothetical protein